MSGRRLWVLAAVSGGITLGFEAASFLVQLYLLDSSYGFYALGALLELVLSLPWLLLLLGAGTLLIMAAALHIRGLLLAGAILQLAFLPCILLFCEILGLLFFPACLLLPILGGMGVWAFCRGRKKPAQQE